MKPAIVLRQAARIWSIASFVFVGAFALGGGGGVPTASEVVALLFFPLGVVVGLLIAWRHEGVGGAIAVLSLAVFYLWLTVEGGRAPRGPYFVLVAAPGFLFLASWLLDRSRARKIRAG